MIVSESYLVVERLPGRIPHPSGSIDMSNQRAVTDGLTAHAGGGQANATAITTPISRFSTVGSSGDSSRLPSAFSGSVLYVRNAGAASMDVFPASGEKINEGSADAAFAVAAGKSAVFFAPKTGEWDALSA